LVEAYVVGPEGLLKVESCDFSGQSRSDIALTKNPVFHQRTNHIDIKYHFVREQVESKQFEFVHVPKQDAGGFHDIEHTPPKV
jgi:hypothetical protein